MSLTADRGETQKRISHRKQKLFEITENTAILEKIAIQIFPIINDCERIFLAWGLELNINVFCGCQKHSPFHFFLQIPVIFQSQFLNFGPCLEPMMLLKFVKRQFL